MKTNDTKYNYLLITGSYSLIIGVCLIVLGKEINSISIQEIGLYFFIIGLILDGIGIFLM
jgi:hypothetical protein